jgi:putative spermidine/putrescine transport system substrate-binding protein
MYRDAKDGKSFWADGGWEASSLSIQCNTLGIRPDSSVVRSPLGVDLSRLSSGKAAIQNIPAIGIMDAIMAMEAAGVVKYGDKGNPTKDNWIRRSPS